MALFEGEQLVDVTAADGRIVQVPSSVAQAMGQAMNPMSAPSPDVSLAPPDAAIPSGADLAAVAPPAPPPEQQIITPSEFREPVTPPGFEGAAVQPTKPAKAPKQTAAPAGPTGDDALAQYGYTGARQEGQAALADQAEAVAGAADVEAAGQYMVSEALAERNKKMDEIAVLRQQEAEKDAQDAIKKEAEITSLVNKHANTKIDRTHDNEALATIGMVLAGLGQAMNKDVGANPAIEIYWKSIDRKVAGQMADLDKLGQTIGYKKDEAERLGKAAGGRLAMRNMMMASEAERSARYVEEIGARTNSDKIKANAQVFAAELRSRGAALTMDAVKGAIQIDQFNKSEANQNMRHKQSIGVQYAGLAQADRHHKDDMQFKREQLLMETQAALAKANAQHGEAGMKRYYELQDQTRSLGIGNVSTGEHLLTKKGYQMMDQAAALEAQAKVIEAQGPEGQAKASQLKQMAEAMRGEAKVVESFKHRDPTQAGKLSEKYGAVQAIATLTDDIKALYEQEGKSYWKTTAGQAAIQAKVTQVTMQLKNAWGLGVLSKQDTALVEQATGGDPTKMDAAEIARKFGFEVGKDPKAFMSRLDSITGELESSVVHDLKIAKWDGADAAGKLVFHKTPHQDTDVEKAIKSSGGKTALESAEATRERGENPITKRLTNFKGETTDEIATNEENTGDKYGFTMANSQSADQATLRAAAKKGDKGAIKALANQINSGRPEMVASTISSLENEAPEVYKQIKPMLDPRVLADRQNFDKQRAELQKNTPSSQLRERQNARGGSSRAVAQQTAIASTPVVDLAKQALLEGPKGAAQTELARKAGLGDKDAKTALEGVINMRARMRGSR